ncbi:MAG: amidophosphoribosyltransferase, partial [Magnetovibrio sp.]|nr:amidophosphoribosyltransferase [Magnetovibrio sp.]
NMSVEEIAKHVGADSLAFISLDGLYRAVGEKSRNAECPQFCDACFTGEYAIPLIDEEGHSGPEQLTLLSES